EPSPQADRRTLLRRLSLDLTGLPPTEAEMKAFLEDPSPEAYARQVDRLLNSPHYGERMAVWWLDVARFTDTVGYHGDQNQRIFPYRDYVIGAFNQNKRFDQFTVEQLAGDLLPKPTTEQLVATGFNRLNMVTREGGAQAKEYLSKYGAERVRTVGGAWMGATLGCSECHDHKFDPFTAKDFYAMQAFFADVKQWGVYSDYGYSPNPELKGWTNEYPFPPEIEVTSPYLKHRSDELRKQMLDAAAKQVVAPESLLAFKQWVESSRGFLAKHPSGWQSSPPVVTVAPAPPAKKGAAPKSEEKVKVKAPAPTVEAEGWIVANTSQPDNTRIVLTPGASTVTAIRLQLMPSAAHKGSILRNGGEGSATVKVMAAILRKDAKKEVALPVAYADADQQDPRYSSTVQVLNLKDGWKTSTKGWDQPQQSVWQLEQPVTLADGDQLVLKLDSNSVARFRMETSPFAPLKPLAADWLTELGAALASPDPASTLLETYVRSAPTPLTGLAEYRQLSGEWLQCREGRTWTMVTQAMPPLTVKVLPRGNWMDESGEVTPPAVPEFLPASFRSVSNQPQATRLDLAKWLCSPENPLTPRAFTNRLWKQFFGNGLSMVVDDLGAQGEPPSHPELLDWIASEFRDSGWDVKHLIRLMVLSETYRQSSSLRPELRDIDPNNRLLASQNPRRLEAEFVRDNALFIAGRLNLDIGGPSVKPYQPDGYYANLQFPDRRYVAEADARQWRRGVYMHWQRTFLHPMLANFDAPMRDECTANRTVSNTPQQALTLLNDPTFVEAARVFAERLLQKNIADDATRLNAAMELAAGRQLKRPELDSLTYFLNSQRELYKASPEDAAKLAKVGVSPLASGVNVEELAAWTSVCRVVLNLQETITRY
ncbi:MAG: DUF1553 domain-containing protein, partial [Verrucomicrobium sp.]